jgi:tetratricopeptide (TPR) repeat protein
MKNILTITLVLILTLSCKSEMDSMDKARELNNKAITIYGSNFNNDDSLKYAIKLLDSAILLRGTYLNFYFNKYKLTMKIKDYPSAIEYCNKIMKIDPKIYTTSMDKGFAL